VRQACTAEEETLWAVAVAVDSPETDMLSSEACLVDTSDDAVQHFAFERAEHDAGVLDMKLGKRTGVLDHALDHPHHTRGATVLGRSDTRRGASATRLRGPGAGVVCVRTSPTSLMSVTMTMKP
jgi:hypothetical protein